MSGSWTVEHRRGPAGALHDRPLGPDVPRAVIVLEPTQTALVLGSTQQEADVDTAALGARGVELARRRSGGGAVLLVPDATLWVDVELPRDDPLWDDDVGRAFHWLGRAWVAALADFGVRAWVNTGALVESRWSRRVCFAGLGPGEVVVGERKLVGISQRRTRDGARFQCVLHRRWDPMPLLELLALSEAERLIALADLADVAVGLDREQARIIDALVRHLPAE